MNKIKETLNYEGLKTACKVFEDPEQAYSQIYTKVWNEGMYNSSRKDIVDELVRELSKYKPHSLKINSINNIFESISDVIELSDIH